MKLIIVFACLCFAAKGQKEFNRPDYEKIKTLTQDKSSKFEYSDLLSRLESYDTTLTAEEYSYLYYGYIFTKEYEPYGRSKQEEKLLKYYQSSDIDKNDYDKIIELCNLSIKENPFDLRQMNFLAYIYHKKGNEEMARKVSRRFFNTTGAILTSGDGKTCSSAFHIISVTHEYAVLNMFEFRFKKQSLRDMCDYLELEENKQNVKGIYFNVEQLMLKNMEKLKGKF